MCVLGAMRAKSRELSELAYCWICAIRGSIYLGQCPLLETAEKWEKKDERESPLYTTMERYCRVMRFNVEVPIEYLSRADSADT